jgi:hypothetical protein
MARRKSKAWNLAVAMLDAQLDGTPYPAHEWNAATTADRALADQLIKVYFAPDSYRPRIVRDHFAKQQAGE